MGKAHKLIEAMTNNPLDWQIDHVKTVAIASGLTVHRPIKAIYIKKLIRLIQTGKGDIE